MAQFSDAQRMRPALMGLVIALVASASQPLGALGAPREYDDGGAGPLADPNPYVLTATFDSDATDSLGNTWPGTWNAGHGDGGAGDGGVEARHLEGPSIAVTASHTYALSMAGCSASGGGTYFTVRWYDAGGTLLSSQNQAAWPNCPTFRYHELNTQAPATATTMRLYFTYSNRYDDIRLEDLTVLGPLSGSMTAGFDSGAAAPDGKLWPGAWTPDGGDGGAGDGGMSATDRLGPTLGVTAGTFYTIAMNGCASSGAASQFRARWYGASGALITDAGTTAWPACPAWNSYQRTFQAPVGASTLRVSFSGGIKYDDVVIADISQTAAQWENLSAGITPQVDAGFNTVFGPGYNDPRMITDGRVDTHALVQPFDPNNGFILDLGQPRGLGLLKIKTTKASGGAYHPHYRVWGRAGTSGSWTVIWESSGSSSPTPQDQLNTIVVADAGPWRQIRFSVAAYTLQSGTANTNWWEAQVWGTGDIPSGPETDFTATPRTGVAGMSVNFQDASSSPVAWAWEFGDGGTSTAQNPSHVYSAPGHYTVKLTTTAADQTITQLTRTNYVGVERNLSQGITPTADATFGTVFGPDWNDPRTVTDGKLDTFALVSPVDPNNGFVIDLGQARQISTVKIKTAKASGLGYHPHYTVSGRVEATAPWTTLHATSGGASPNTNGALNSISITNPGPWRYLRLQVSSYTSQSGAHNTNWYEAQIFGPGEPVTGGVRAHFTSSAAQGSSPANVTFTDSSAGATSWLWRFGDGTTSTQQNPVHQYPSGGSYDVRLTATGPSGSDVSTSPAAFGGTRLVSVGARVMPDPGFGTIFTGNAQAITDVSHATAALVAPPDPNNGFIIDLGQPMPVTQLKIKTVKSGGLGYHPHYTIMGRATASAPWTMLHTTSGGSTAHRNGELNAVNILNNGPWRYLRVQLSSYTAQSATWNTHWYTADVYGVPPRGWVPIPQRFVMGGPNPHQKDPTFSRAEPVNTRSGVYWTTATDLSMPGRGLGVVLERTYSSGGLESEALGPGWTHGYASRLELLDDGSRIFVSETGAQIGFVPTLDGEYVAPAGVLSTLAADGTGYLLTTQRGLRYGFDAGGRLVSLADRNDNTVSFSYTGNDLTTITDTVGREVDLAYDASHRLIAVTDPLNRTVEYAYDVNGRLRTVTDLRGETTTYSYDAAGRLASVVDGNGNAVVRNTYDTDGRIVEQLDARDNLTTFEWDPITLTSTMTDARGGQWVDIFDGAALVEQRDPLGNSTLYEYDEAFNRTAITDPRGTTTTMTYDADGNLLSATAPAPLNYVTEFTYNAFGDVLTATNARGNATTSEYDAAGNLVEVTEPGNAVTTFTRDPGGTGRLVSTTDARGKTTTYGYDAQSNLTSTTDALGNVTTMTYDALGRVTSTVDARGNQPGAYPDDFRSTLTYDGDLVASTIDPLGNTVTTAYDPVGNRISITDPLGNLTSYTYDDGNHLLTVTDPDLNVTAYAYDQVGNLVTRTDANAHVTTYAYDLAGRLESTTDPLGNDWLLTYDANGNLLTRTDARDQVTTYAYDVLNGRTAIDYGPAGTSDVGYTYDANGNLTQLTDGAGTETYAYDTRNRLTAVTRGPDTFAYAYDVTGNLISRTYPGGQVTAYAYDDAGRMASATVGSNVTAYAFDPAGQLLSAETPDGLTAVHSYDRAGRLREVAHVNDSATLSRFTYGLDAAGRRTNLTTTLGATGFAYDDRGQLIEACFGACPAQSAVPELPCLACIGDPLPRPAPTTSPDLADDFVRYTYDPVGNRLSEQTHLGSTTSAYDAADRLTSFTPPGASAITYTYDANGNQTAAGADTFAWDATDRLTAATVDGSTHTYAYAGDGRRLSTTSAGSTTGFVWDLAFGLSMLVAERDGTGVTLRSYAYGLDLLSQSAGGATSYYHHDGLGSVVDLTDPVGASLAWAEYGPFGDPRYEAAPAGAPANPFGFTGEYLDPTGLYHLRARQYDPGIGRFLSQDPVAPTLEDPYVASYVYALNDPCNRVDPSGEASCPGVAIASALLLGALGTVELALAGASVAVAPSVVGEAALLPAHVATFWAMGQSISNIEQAGHKSCEEIEVWNPFDIFSDNSGRSRGGEWSVQPRKMPGRARATPSSSLSPDYYSRQRPLK